MDYLLLAGLVWEKNTVLGWKFTIVYEQANMLMASPVDIVHSLAVVSEEAARENRPVNCATDESSGKAEGNTV